MKDLNQVPFGLGTLLGSDHCKNLVKSTRIEPRRVQQAIPKPQLGHATDPRTAQYIIASYNTYLYWTKHCLEQYKKVVKVVASIGSR